MNLNKLPYDPGALLEFFSQGLETLGALCERTWHDRLQIVAEGPAAMLWDPTGELVEKELWFPPAGDPAPRQAATEVFPGCPLTFRLAEALGSPTLQLQRAILNLSESRQRPSPVVAEKLWHQQHPGQTGWRLHSAFRLAWHFSLLALARCEIQAIDQHWSLQRLALSLPGGEPDPSLTEALPLCDVVEETTDPVPWPSPDPAGWHRLLRTALAAELQPDLDSIRHRQENYLRRELHRIDDYFQSYQQELMTRLDRGPKKTAKDRLEERLVAARAEHERRRLDQVHRHEIHVIPRLDALLLLAEPAWRATVSSGRRDDPRVQEALLVPRLRRWFV